MANFPPPPPPPSGGGFNNNALFTTYVSANLPGLAQYSYHPSSAAGSQGSVLAGSALDAQYANAYSFNTNQQGAVTGSGVNDMSTPSFNTQGQLPVPVSRSPSAQYPAQMQGKPGSYKNSLHDSGTSRNNPQLNQASQSKDIFQDTKPAITTATFSDLEDGELSEGNNDERSGVQGIEAQSHMISLPSAGHYAHDEVNDTIITADRPSLPVSAYSKVVMATYGSVETSNPTAKQHSSTIAPQQQSVMKATHALPNGQSALSSMPVDDNSFLNAAKRQKARGALAYTYEGGLDPIQIFPEGIDPTVLSKLYTELGVQVSDMEVTAAQENKSGIAHSPQSNGADLAGLATTLPRSTARGLHEERQSGQLSPGHPSTAFETTNGSLRHDVITNGVKDMHSVADKIAIKKKEVQAASTSKTQNTSSSAKISHPSIASSDKAYDRKDHIARLLAAKAGKSGSTANTPTSPIVSKASNLQEAPLQEVPLQTGTRRTPLLDQPTEVENPSQVHSTDATVDRTQEPLKSVTKMPTATADPKIAISHTKPVGPVEVGLTDAEEKKRAQTELARRKMEALMSRNNKARAEAASQPTVISSSDRQAPAAKPISSGAKVEPQPLSVITGPQAPPTPRSSFFSPTPGRQFSLPGLFMPSASQTSNENTVTQTQQDISTFSDAQQPISKVVNGAVVASASLRNATANREPIKSFNQETSGGISPSTEIINSTRKRQKAADFIEAPTTRVKRLFGQSGDNSVVIDVSDDEAPDSSLNDVEMDIDTDQDMYGIGQGRPDESNKLQRSAPNNVQLQRRPSALGDAHTSVGIMTAPVAPVSGKETNALKSKEKEIEVIKRRIAEKEQRRQAKQSISRAESPTITKVSSPLKESRDPSESIEQAAIVPVLDNEAILEKVQADQEILSVEPMTENKSLDKEQLDPEQQKIDAELHPTHASDVQRRSETRQLEQQQHQRDLEERHLQELSEQRHKQLEVTQQVEAERDQIREGEKEQAMQSEEEVRRQLEGHEVGEVLRHRQEIQAREATERKSALKAAKKVEKERKLQRKSAIQAGLPILDAEVEKTEQKLQKLRSQIQELETELQHGVDGRRNLIEELQALSPDSKTSLVDPDEHDATKNTQDLSGGGKQESYDADEVVESASIAIVNSISSNLVDDRSRLDAAIHGPSELSLPSAVGLASNSELGKDIMDLSKSDLDEGEISEYSPRSMSRAQSVARSADVEDTYEPPTVINVQQHPAPTLLQSQPHRDDGQSDPTPVPAVQSETAQMVANSHRMEDQGGGNTKLLGAHTSGMEESDDYEPPEPLSPAGSPMSEGVITVNGGQPRLTVAASGEEQSSVTTVSREDQSNTMTTSSDAHPVSQRKYSETKLNQSRYTPYESPLKYFKSYRYHRCFPDDVVDGFRSLTYSHNIKAEEPICPFEIGGTCNDQTCPYQHFRNMNLSDNMILLQLGSAPNDLTAESQSAYNDGLKNVIRDIRSRNVRDFNAMAADITAYRANFIGDRTKVLPL